MPDLRRPGAVRLALAGQAYCTVSVQTVAAERLEVGMSVDGGLAERLAQAADVEAAYRTVLRALELRSYAAADLLRRIVRKGHLREVAEEAVERARQLGLLDDAAYAMNYVQTRAARGRGPARLVRELSAMGVSRALIDRAIAAEWPEGSDRMAAPLALATKRASQLGRLPRPVLRRRLLAYLARRGFAGHEITEIVRKVAG